MTIRPFCRVSVVLDDDVGTALARMCQQDMRPPRQQLAWIVRAEAQRRGLLENDETAGGSLAANPAVADGDNFTWDAADRYDCRTHTEKCEQDIAALQAMVNRLAHQVKVLEQKLENILADG